MLYLCRHANLEFGRCKFLLQFKIDNVDNNGRKHGRVYKLGRHNHDPASDFYGECQSSAMYRRGWASDKWCTSPHGLGWYTRGGTSLRLHPSLL